MTLPNKFHASENISGFAKQQVPKRCQPHLGSNFKQKKIYRGFIIKCFGASLSTTGGLHQSRWGKSETVIRVNCGKRVQSDRNTTQQLQRESTKFPVQQDHFIYLLHKISKMEDEMCEEEAQMMLPFMLVVCAADAKI